MLRGGPDVRLSQSPRRTATPSPAVLGLHARSHPFQIEDRTDLERRPVAKCADCGERTSSAPRLTVRSRQTEFLESAYAGGRGRAKGKNIPLPPEVTTSSWSVRRALARPSLKLIHHLALERTAHPAPQVLSSAAKRLLCLQEGLAVNFRRAACTALLAPIALAGGILISAVGSTNVLAASGSSVTSKTPETSSRPHENERVQCSPAKVAQRHGQCAVVFLDKTKNENPVGQQVCFSVSPIGAGTIETGTGNCAFINKNDKALGTFATTGTYCGKAVVTAVETGEASEQKHHTTITIVCTPVATTTAAILPAGSPLPPAGWLLGAMGVGLALVTGYAVRTRRWFAPRRHAASQSA